MATTHIATRSRRRRRTRDLAGLGFVTPFLAVLTISLLLPVGYAVYLSFQQTRLVGGTTFVGLDNYLRVLADPQFHSAMLNVTIFMLIQVPAMLLIAALAALALDSGRLYLASTFRVVLFLPHAVPSVVIALMWGFMYGVNYGLVGNANSFFGLELSNPLTGATLYPAIANVITWEYAGYNMLILYSALTAIPRDLYEAAEIDGASRLRVAWSIKVPAMRGAFIVALMFSVIGTLQLFNSVSVLKDVGSNSITTYFSPNLYAFSLSFAGQQLNYAAALSIVVGVVTALAAFLVRFGEEKSHR